MDWTEEGISDEQQSPLRRPGASSRPQPPPPRLQPRRTSVSRSMSPSRGGLPRMRALGSRSLSPSPTRALRSPSPSRVGLPPIRSFGARPIPHSVRTRSPPRSPVVPGNVDEDHVGVDDILASLRDQRARLRLDARQDAIASSSSITGGGEAAAEGPGFSFPPLADPQNMADAADVLDVFVGAETPRRVNAEFVEATMSATVGARREELKKELLDNERVVDLMGLEKWLRRMEAVAELAWFTEKCSDEGQLLPSLDLFDCSFRALERLRSGELHRGADARRLWNDSLAVPEYFLCPISKKVMEDPVVISSGKTVDRSALQKWWKKNNKRICPVTEEVLSHSIFVPNVLIKKCITLWRSIREQTRVAGPPFVSSEDEAMFKEVTRLAHSPLCSKQAYDAIFRLHELVGGGEEQCAFQYLLGRSPGTITQLVCVLPETCLDPDPELDNVILDIIANAASFPPNKEVFGDDRYTIPVLIARAFLGPLPTRVKCARILGLLADENYYNKIKIGELGGFAALVELLLVGDTDIKRTVAIALASLCEAQENWSRFLREEVVDAVISMMEKDGLVEEAYNIFKHAAGCQPCSVEVAEKLLSKGKDGVWKEMAMDLSQYFLQKTQGQRRREGFPPGFGRRNECEASSSSSQGSVDPKDIHYIVSWLLKKSYCPRTYRYFEEPQITDTLKNLKSSTSP